MKPEALIKAKIKRALAANEIFFFMPTMGLYGATGASDFICCAKGRMLVIEAKATPDKKPTNIQELFLTNVVAHGGVAWVIHSGNVGELPHRLRTLLCSA